MVNNLKLDNKRLYVVDALRGFAIFLIFLIHNIQYFGIQFHAQSNYNWLNVLNDFLTQFIFFLFGNKAFQIFSLLFGLTFFIQKAHLKFKNINPYKFFLWRFFLLFCFGLFNSIFYRGDILVVFAILGVLLIPLSQLNSKLILVIVVFLIFLPFELFKLSQTFKAAIVPIKETLEVSNYNTNSNLKYGSFLDVLINNLLQNKIGNLKFNLNSGRMSIILAMFLLGVLLGRKQLFLLNKSSSIRFWKKVFIFSFVFFVIGFILNRTEFLAFGSLKTQNYCNLIFTMLPNTFFTFILVAFFVLVFKVQLFNRFFNLFSSLGKMSLTNYILQSIIGAFLYYGYGLGLYKITGALQSILITIFVSVLMSIFSKYWLTKYSRGPFETLWHKASWYFFK